MKLKLTVLALALATLHLPVHLHAQIRTDGSLGLPAQNLAGPNYLIPQSLGKLAGSNLFQSFQGFQLASGESATFTTSSAGIANVISRVTGGEASLIQGQIRLVPFSGTPAFFFINPAGVVFGQGASIDVPGAFLASTANSLRFVDGSRLHADLGENSSFSSAAPEAFGFLGSTRATLAVRDQAVLAANAQQLTQLVGGDVLIDNATIVSSGAIRVAAVGAQAVDVPVNAPMGATSPPLSGQFTMIYSLIGSSSTSSLDAGQISIDAGDIALFDESSISSFTRAGTTGKGADIELRASGSLLLDFFSNVFAKTSSDGHAGSIRLSARDITLSAASYVEGGTDAGTTGRAGDIVLRATQGLTLDGGASLYSTIAGSGDGGLIDASAALISISGAAYTANLALDGSSGRGGDTVLRATQGLSLDGSRILSNAEGTGRGGAIDIGAGTLDLSANARIIAGTSGAGQGGGIHLAAGSMNIRGNSYAATNAEASTGKGGDLKIQTPGMLSLSDGGELRAYADSGGGSGQILVDARDIRLDTGAQISTAAVGPMAVSGSIELRASGALSLHGGAGLLSIGSSGGKGGNISATARQATLDSRGFMMTGSLDANGAGGNVLLNTSGAIALSGGAYITANTFTEVDGGTITLRGQDISLASGAYLASNATDGIGNAGNIELVASRRVDITAPSSIISVSSTPGRAGQVRIAAADFKLTGQGGLILTSAFEPFSGDAGKVEIITSGSLTVSDHALIDSSSLSLLGHAGDISLKAGSSLLIDAAELSSRSVASEGSGRAGTIRLEAAGQLTLSHEARASTTTYSGGNAGLVSLTAANITLDQSDLTSLAGPGSRGAAGTIELKAQQSLLLDDGLIGTTTSGSGPAGNIRLGAQDIRIEGARSGATAAAGEGSGGQTGGIELAASGSLRMSEGATLTIRNDATVANPSLPTPTLLQVSAPRIELAGAAISAESSGNVAASRIAVAATESLSLLGSIISTSANEGNGGALSLDGGGLLVIDNSQVTTSVLGSRGNGGNITVSADTLLMKTGFIQANTAAANASGGLVLIDVDALLASGNTLFVGGELPLTFQFGAFGFNVIQAAAPTGVSGDIAMTSPVLDLTGSLVLLNARMLDPGGLGRNPCQSSGGSSLALGGRGGLAPSARGLLSARPAGDAGKTMLAAGELPQLLIATASRVSCQ